jgi:hypothetical protein
MYRIDKTPSVEFKGREMRKVEAAVRTIRTRAADSGKDGRACKRRQVMERIGTPRANYARAE